MITLTQVEGKIFRWIWAPQKSINSTQQVLAYGEEVVLRIGRRKRKTNIREDRSLTLLKLNQKLIQV